VDIKHSTITNNDVQLVVESLPADFDNDIDVDGNDFLIWQRNVGRINAQKSQGDANNDAVVNGGDLAVWRNSIGAPTSVPNAGSGVASQGNGATRTTVQSSIIAGNRGPGGVGTDIDSVDPSTFNSFQSLGYNLIGVGNATAAFNQTGDVKNVTDPVLGPLAFNGLPAGVMFDLFTHAVLPGSPAINAGSPAFNPNSFTPPLTLDQRGAARVQAGRIDIGAYESAFFPAVVASESFASPSSAAALVAEEPESGPYQPSVAASGASSLALLGDVSAMFDGDNPISSDSTEAALAREATLRDGALTVLSSRTFRPELRSRISVDELEPLVSAGDERDAAGDAEDEVFAAWGEDLLI